MAATAGLAAPGATGLGRPLVLRSLLVSGCLLAVWLAAATAAPSAASAGDPDLARLLRGMAVIKGSAVLLFLGLLWWRFGAPIGFSVAAAYLIGAAALSAATMLIWQLAWIGAAAAIFHVAALMLLVLAWRDGMPRRRPQHR
jgi:hypothetical protein